MITIETIDFIGYTRDVVGFAPSTRVDPDNAYVRFTWDGEALRISTYATLHGAIATWTPTDQSLGGDDAPWEMLLSAPAVKGLIQDYDLRGKKADAKLQLEVVGDDLVVTRNTNEETGVIYKRTRYPHCGDAQTLRAEEALADLGPRDPEKNARMSEAVLAGAAKATKRTSCYLEPTACTNGVRATISDHLLILARYPAPVDQDEVDADAIVASAQDDL